MLNRRVTGTVAIAAVVLCLVACGPAAPRSVAVRGTHEASPTPPVHVDAEEWFASHEGVREVGWADDQYGPNNPRPRCAVWRINDCIAFITPPLSSTPEGVTGPARRP